MRARTARGSFLDPRTKILIWLLANVVVFTWTPAVFRIAVMLGAILLSFGMGFLLRPLVKEPYRKYVPFLVSVYEGGMIGYPLYTSLCSTENLPVCSARALRPSSAASWCRACWRQRSC